MWALYLAGLAKAARRGALVAVLGFVNLAFALGFGSLAWFWLALALDRSLATRSLLYKLDVNVFVDLFVHHRESFLTFMFGAVLLLVVAVLIWIWLNAVVVVAVAEEGEWGRVAHRAIDVFLTFLGLWFLMAGVLGGLLGAIGIGAWGLTRWTESSSEMGTSLVLGGAVGLGLLTILILATVHDHARIHSAATGARALSAYAWAAAFLLRTRLAIPLAAVFAVTGIVLWGIYQSVAAFLVTESVPGVVLATLWGQTWLFVRVFTRVWMFAAETELQNVTDVAA
jgi:hypothetical protein